MRAAYLPVSGHLVLVRNILTVFASFHKMRAAYFPVSGHLVIQDQQEPTNLNATLATSCDNRPCTRTRTMKIVV